MGFFFRPTPVMVSREQALPGRDESVLGPVAPHHLVFERPITDTPEGSAVAYFALGCFWGEEKMFWGTPGVTNTAVGYQGGFTPHPTYEEVCSGRTGHTETVRVCFDPSQVSYEALVQQFFEAHDPTQGFRQGNDVGTQYRSALFPTDPAQTEVARTVRDRAQLAYRNAGYGELTTEITPLSGTGAPDEGEPRFYYAEEYHQQYLIRVPNGYCPVHATGVNCGG